MADVKEGAGGRGLACQEEKGRLIQNAFIAIGRTPVAVEASGDLSRDKP